MQKKCRPGSSQPFRPPEVGLSNGQNLTSQKTWHTGLNEKHMFMPPPKCSRVDFSILLGRYMFDHPRKCKKNVVPDCPRLLDHQKWACQIDKISVLYLLINQVLSTYCQAQVRSPKVQSPKVQSPKVKTKGTWADTKITRVWITSSTGCITSSTKEYNLLHREYNLLHHPPLTQMNCITSSTTHLQLKWIVQPPHWWLSLLPPPPPTPWALTLHFTPQNLRVYNLLNLLTPLKDPYSITGTYFCVSQVK